MDKNEELYLACYQTLLIYYLKKKVNVNLPIDLIYCTALETTSRIYKGSFIDKKSRFDYENQMKLENLEKLNINLKVSKCSNFKDLKYKMLELLNKRIETFIYVDEYYLPYSLQYKKLHTNHSQMVFDYEEGRDGSIIFHTVDNVGATIKQQKCAEEYLKMGFESVDKKFIIHFEVNESSLELDKFFFLRQIKNTVMNYEDNYEIFYDFIGSSERKFEKLQTQTETLSFYSHTFGLISGSRYCFLKAIKSLNFYNQKIDSYLTRYYQEAKVLMFLFGKAVFSSKLNIDNVKEKCEYLLELDKKLIMELKNVLEL
ncbi:hypothetical protein KFZ56_05120 [Virgibacillus sp. NKC19-3]|uniref:BtrH N-terminal domain-containing protein n=1 Tax=Virgibacillus saliphilus TaxID=2831674 RepID=UPI001C9B5EA3|nr:BtrH N-terminal domain-containing protein [Virgibacillus sp. NKC19-3]MBY7142469.1 hypothetical protein [Virgibacillus sp. NKC19-3]